MSTPEFVLALRAKVGHDPLWLSGVTAVVTREVDGRRQLLLVRRADDGRWTPVTGIIDPGEQPADAAAREVAEEAGVVAVPERLVQVHALAPMTYPNGDRSQYLDLVFACRWVSGEPWPADGENTAAAFFDLSALPPMSTEMADRVRVGLDGAERATFLLAGAVVPGPAAGVGAVMPAPSASVTQSRHIPAGPRPAGPTQEDPLSTAPRLVAFDLDDTLAPSKSPLDPRMSDLLARLLAVVPVCVISGGQFGQFRTQVVDRLPELDAVTAARLHLMPTCGTQYWRAQAGGWQQVYAENLTEDEKQRAVRALETQARRLGLWEEQTWGPVLEDRGSQITFSALGQAAPVDAKSAWDPTGERKTALREAVAALVPDLEVRSGGSTSVDVTRKGIDKAYGMRRLAELTGIALDEMLFVGDRLDEAGNDYPVKALGVPCHAVTGWPDTADYLTALIPTLG